MKKFDAFLILVAVGLIGLGYYFAKEFKAENEVTSKVQKENVNKSNPRLPSSSKVKKSPNTKKKQQYTPYVQKYLSLKKCLGSGKCDFSNSDPRAYELEVMNAINKHIQTISNLGDRSHKKVLYDAAKLSNGHVKASVLQILQKNSIYNNKWRDLVLNEYVNFYDANLVPAVLEYFKEFSPASDKKLIHSQIYKAISNGSPMVANALTDNINLLLDSSSAQFYKKRLSNLSDGPIKDHLKRKIKDFEILESAG